MNAVTDGAQARHAGFWLRFVAIVIDTIVLSIVLYVVTVSFGVSFDDIFIELESMQNELYYEDEDYIFILMAIMFMSIIQFLLYTVVDWLYFAVMESSPMQGTLGKRALGLRVTDENGDRIGFGRATGRYFAKIISALILMIGFFMAGWTRKKQGLHDIMAGTLVIKS